MNPIEEKPQKADLRAQIQALAGLTHLNEKAEADSRWIIEREVLALIDADSKAREEETKRLADELKELSEKLNRYGYVLFAQKLTREEKDWINNAFSEVAIRLNQIAGELTASKQDSEGTG